MSSGSSGHQATGVPDVGAVPAVGDVPSSTMSPWSAKVADFCSGGAASRQMTPSMIDGLTQNVWDENPMAIMEKLLQESKKPKPLRDPPFCRAEFLNSVNGPKENPWWILFGYDTDRGHWKGAPASTTLKASMVSCRSPGGQNT